MNSEASGTLLEGDSDYFQTSGVNRVVLNSLSGDADLFVFADPALSNLLCDSQFATRDDVCDLDTEGTLYVQVFGYGASDYSVQFTGPAPVPPVTLEPTVNDYGALIANQQTSRDIELQSLHLYAATGIGEFELTSETGDVDLLIFTDTIFDDADPICISQEYSRDSVLDRCVVPSSADSTLQVAVFGFEASSYTLVGLAPLSDDPVPADPPVAISPEIDQPVADDSLPGSIVSADSGGSGGGVAGLASLFVGLILACCRYRRRRVL